MTGHDIAHYIIAAGLAMFAGGLAVHVRQSDTDISGHIANLTAQSHQGIAVPAPRDAWPSLEPSAVVKMADALQAEPAPGMVDIWCPSISCTALAADIDDAFQILNWEDQMQSERIDSNDDPGVSVGGGAQEVVRAKLAGALSDALGQPVAIVDMPPDAPLSVIIGRHKP